VNKILDVMKMKEMLNSIEEENFLLIFFMKMEKFGFASKGHLMKTWDKISIRSFFFFEMI